MQKSFIICYHRVIDDDDSYLRPTKVKEFENQMRYLLNAYNPVPLTAICQHIQNGKTLPRKAVAITLDDGYKDNYRNAYPILRKHKIPATVFLTTKYISTKEIPCWDKVYYILNKARIQGTVSFFSKSAGYSMPLDRQAMNRLVRILKRLSEKKQSQAIVDLANQLDVRLDDLSNEDLMLSWEEVQEMSDNGIDFGSHTLTHPYLTEISHREAEQEVYLSKEIIERYIDNSVTAFSYPSVYYNADIKKVVEDAGYHTAVSTIPGYNNSKADRYALNRNVICGRAGSSLLLFRAEITGKVEKLRRYYHTMKGLRTSNA